MEALQCLYLKSREKSTAVVQMLLCKRRNIIQVFHNHKSELFNTDNNKSYLLVNISVSSSPGEPAIKLQESKDSNRQHFYKEAMKEP